MKKDCGELFLIFRVQIRFLGNRQLGFIKWDGFIKLLILLLQLKVILIGLKEKVLGE